METLIQHFFDCDHYIEAIPIPGGNINDTFEVKVIHDGQLQSWLLQRLNHHVFKAPETVMENLKKVADHLRSSNYPYQIPVPVPTKQGKYLYEDGDGNYWRLFPFIQQAFVPEGQITPEIASQAARAYGAFASALSDFPVELLAETIPGFHDTMKRWAYFEAVLSQDLVGRKSSVTREIDALMGLKPVFEQVAQLKASGALPLRVTHNDTKAGNILFDRDTRRPVAVIDLDTVMPGTILSDFGDMVRTFTPDHPEGYDGPLTCRADILKAIHEGFLSETAHFLTSTEQEHLLLGGLWITGEQALRFLSDYLAGDTYYKIQYPDHNLVRARNQLSLCAALGASARGMN